jgi:hypothetical protein
MVELDRKESPRNQEIRNLLGATGFGSGTRFERTPTRRYPQPGTASRRLLELHAAGGVINGAGSGRLPASSRSSSSIRPAQLVVPLLARA